MTHVSTPIFQRLFRNMVFRYVALVIKKVKCYFRFFFTQTVLFTALYPTLCIKNIKKNYKNSLNYYLLKVKKFHGDSVKNDSARAKKLEGGAKRPPPLFRLKQNQIILKNI